MQVPAHRTGQYSWLMLLVVFVFCMGLVSPVSWAESQQQKIELESEAVPEPTEVDALTAGAMRESAKSNLLLLNPGFSRTRAAVINSDAYSSIILHGPPSPAYYV